MHQRRHRHPSEAVRHAIVGELLQGWRTVKELHERIGVTREWIGKVLPQLAGSQVIFARKRTEQFHVVREYRIYPEARGVQRG